MLDLDQLVVDCISASKETEPRSAVKEVVQRAVAGTGLHAGGPTDPVPGLNVVYNTPALTVIDVVWPPLMSLFPHDHRMWAAIGIYGGREDNTFFRRSAGRILTSGGKEMQEGDVLLMGDDAIHAVHNPLGRHTGAIHVYGGDFVGTPRSQWDAESLDEQPYDLEAVRQAFERAQRAFESRRN